MRTLKIYLHTDDFAATRRMTEGMLDRWKHGCLDGFSIMANGDAVEFGQSALQAEPSRSARLVAHLNLSEGASSVPPAQVPLLVDLNGMLRHGFGSLALAWLLGGRKHRQSLVAQVELEWRAQIRTIARLVGPRKLDGIDGHVHVHMLPFLFPVAARLASEFGISTIRVSREPFHLEHGWKDLLSASVLVNLLKHGVLRACAKFDTRIVAEQGLQAPDFVVGILYSGRMTAAAALAGIAAAKRRGARSVEVIFHVGRAGAEETARWGERHAFADFPCSYKRDLEFAELALLHENLKRCGER